MKGKFDRSLQIEQNKYDDEIVKKVSLGMMENITNMSMMKKTTYIIHI